MVSSISRVTNYFFPFIRNTVTEVRKLGTTLTPYVTAPLSLTGRGLVWLRDKTSALVVGSGFLVLYWGGKEIIRSSVKAGSSSKEENALLSLLSQLGISLANTSQIAIDRYLNTIKNYLIQQRDIHPKDKQIVQSFTGIIANIEKFLKDGTKKADPINSLVFFFSVLQQLRDQLFAVNGWLPPPILAGNGEGLDNDETIAASIRALDDNDKQVYVLETGNEVPEDEISRIQHKMSVLIRHLSIQASVYLIFDWFLGHSIARSNISELIKNKNSPGQLLQLFRGYVDDTQANIIKKWIAKLSVWLLILLLEFSFQSIVDQLMPKLIDFLNEEDHNLPKVMDGASDFLTTLIQAYQAAGTDPNPNERLEKMVATRLDYNQQQKGFDSKTLYYKAADYILTHFSPRITLSNYLFNRVAAVSTYFESGMLYLLSPIIDLIQRVLYVAIFILVSIPQWFVNKIISYTLRCIAAYFRVLEKTVDELITNPTRYGNFLYAFNTFLHGIIEKIYGYIKDSYNKVTEDEMGRVLNPQLTYSAENMLKHFFSALKVSRFATQFELAEYLNQRSLFQVAENGLSKWVFENCLPSLSLVVIRSIQSILTKEQKARTASQLLSDINNAFYRKADVTIVESMAKAEAIDTQLSNVLLLIIQHLYKQAIDFSGKQHKDALANALRTIKGSTAKSYEEIQKLFRNLLLSLENSEQTRQELLATVVALRGVNAALLREHMDTVTQNEAIAIQINTAYYNPLLVKARSLNRKIDRLIFMVLQLCKLHEGEYLQNADFFRPIAEGEANLEKAHLFYFKLVSYLQWVPGLNGILNELIQKVDCYHNLRYLQVYAEELQKLVSRENCPPDRIVDIQKEISSLFKPENNPQRKNWPQNPAFRTAIEPFTTTDRITKKQIEALIASITQNMKDLKQPIIDMTAQLNATSESAYLDPHHIKNCIIASIRQQLAEIDPCFEELQSTIRNFNDIPYTNVNVLVGLERMIISTLSIASHPHVTAFVRNVIRLLRNPLTAQYGVVNGILRNLQNI